MNIAKETEKLITHETIFPPPQKPAGRSRWLNKGNIVRSGLTLVLATTLIASVGVAKHSGALETGNNVALAFEPPSDKTGDREFLLSNDDAVLQSIQKQPVVSAIKANMVNGPIQGPEGLETRNKDGFTLTQLFGQWSNDNINILIAGDKFDNDQEFILEAIRATNQLFSVEPFASSIERFGVYTLSVKDTPALGCFEDRRYPLCNNHNVNTLINQVTTAHRLHLPEAFILSKNEVPIARGYYDGPVSPASRYSYAAITTTALKLWLTAMAHEAGHSIGNLVDEYDNLGVLKHPSANTAINCQDQDATGTIVKWKGIPNQPGTKYQGCNNSNGFRDAENDMMRFGSSFGPVDEWQLNKVIAKGPRGYLLFPLPETILHRIYLPIIPTDRSPK